MSKFWKDALERVGWTVVQAVAGVAILTLTDTDLAWAVIVIPMLTAVKVFAAKKVGDPETAAIGGNG
jgi:EamA domain-containing membrane protein RarD